jgi:protein-S-isoprenylcysteine O-methyltransferase Ste14
MTILLPVLSAGAGSFALSTPGWARRDNMWTIRLILLGGLAAMTLLDLHLLRHRHKRQRLIESWVFNTLLVVAYFSCCCLVAALPPARGWDQRLAWWTSPGVRIGFIVVGTVLLCLGLVLSLASLGQRRALGLQESRAGLLTSGVYRHFRHPIYAGILWVCLGLSLLTRNPDGLALFPALLAIFIVQALIEEKYDVSVRFHDQYREYRLATRMFGPVWLWSLLIGTILLLILYPAWTARPGRAGLRPRPAVHRIDTEGITSCYGRENLPYVLQFVGRTTRSRPATPCTSSFVASASPLCRPHPFVGRWERTVARV